MSLSYVQDNGTFNDIFSANIKNRPLISELDGSCGVGANFRRALQRNTKYTTYCLQFPLDAGGKSFRLAPYTGSPSIIASGDSDPATQNGYPVGGLVNANLSKFQTNLSQGGRPCPTTPESVFILAVIQFIAEGTKFVSTLPADGYTLLTSAEFTQANRYNDAIMHEALRASALTYRNDQDGCDAQLNTGRFFPSGYGKFGLDAASHNGASLKGNAVALNALVPIIQSLSDGQPNTSKLLLEVDPTAGVALGTNAPPPVLAANTVLIQEVTVIMEGFCVPRDIALLMCSRASVERAKTWLSSGVFDIVTGKSTTPDQQKPG